MGIRDIYRRVLPRSVREPISRAVNWPPGANVSFSAYGEDLIVRGWLDSLGVERTSVRYLDVGASHPSILSNTFLFYRMGGSGVLVEPTPHEAALIRAARPRDRLIEAGVAFDETRSATLFQFAPSVYNTMDPEQASRNLLPRSADDPIRKIGEVRVPLIPAMEIVDKYMRGDCHLLSVDVEGVDSAIVASIDFRTFRPWFICCERPDGAARSSLESAGYRQIAEVPHDRVYVRDDITLPF